MAIDKLDPALSENEQVRALKQGYKYGWHDKVSYDETPQKGLSHDVIEMISRRKDEPDWMRAKRHRALDYFYARPVPTWGADLSGIDFDDIYYYIKPTSQVKNWEDMPESIRETWDKLGIPEAEKNFLGGVSAQYECLRAFTNVPTDRGPRLIKEIEAGDTVFALNEASKEMVRALVISKRESGDKEVFEIRAGGRVIGASANHPFLVQRDERQLGGQFSTDWVAVADLKVGDRVAVAIGLTEPIDRVEGAGAELESSQLDFAGIESITPVGIEITYDIEVEGHHNFVAEGFIVHNSESVYHSTKKELEDQGVIFADMDTALREHPDIVKKYFGTIIPANDNKFAALNSAVWSGGSFIWVPEGVSVEVPLQAYFRINQENMGQFERTLIICEPNSWVHYVEGCLPAGELVSMADGGHRPIESILVGENVLSSDGSPVRVKAVQVRDYSGPIHSFTPLSTDNAFRVTSEHPLLAVRRESVRTGRPLRNGWKAEVSTRKLLAAEPEWIEAKDVQEGDFLVFPKPKPTPARTELPLELGRLAGYYLADGSASLFDGYKGLQFSLNINDHESIDEIRRLCKDLYDTPGSINWVEHKNEARVVVYTTAGYEAMKAHVGTGSHTKQLSPDFMGQNEEFLRGLVDTYMRGDGNIVRKGGGSSNRAATTSRTWAHQLQAIMARLGIYATVRLERKGGPALILGRNVIRRDMYKIVWTEGRTMGEVRYARDHFLVPIRKIVTERFEGLVHNLDVAAPDSYLAAGFAVHNCSAPVYSGDSLHSAVVEIIVKDGARCRYTTIQNWSSNVYNLVTKRAVAHKNATMEWIDGNIGCLCQGSRVTTRTGMKPIELVTPGEEVVSYDEARGELCWRRVLGKKYSGEQTVREVTLGMRRLLVTDNHPFLSYTYDGEIARKRGRYDLAYIRADELTEVIVPRVSLEFGEPWKLKMPELTTTFTGSNQYDAGFTSVRTRKSRLGAYEETTDDLMWLLGAFTGDGSIDSKPAKNGGHRWARVVFSIPRDDRARDRLVRVMSEVMPETKPTERRDGVTLSWNSVELVEFFEANGFVTGAGEKRLPDWIFSLPESQRLSFIAGYLDTDGCAPRTGRGLQIKSVNRWLLEDVGELLATLGVTARLYTESTEERPVQILGYESVCRGSYRLELPCDERILALVSDKLREAAEVQRVPAFSHGRRIGRSQQELPASVEVRKVKVSKPLATVPTWDIEVEGTGNFIAEGFIVHNSKVTMKYPAVILAGEGAKAEILSVAYASEGQHQDAGAKVTHVAPNTQSTIVSKSISKDGGRAGYRGLVKVDDGATHAKSNVRCDALILDEKSRSDTYPYNEVEEESASVGHEATVSKVGDEQLFYLMSRGINETEAMSLIVRGFIEPITKELPLEYAVELNRLVELQMEGSVG